MTDNEIIKALERLSAEDPDGFSADVLEMVNRLLAEIRELEKMIEICLTSNSALSYSRNQSDEKNKKLQAQIDDLRVYENKIKVAAYKDFADMVKDTFFRDISNSTPKEAKFPCDLMYAIEKEIDKALKEMVGEDE